MPGPVRNASAARLVPPTLSSPGAPRFWLVVVLTGLGTGFGAAALTWLLEAVQRRVWSGNGVDLLAAASRASPGRHVLALLGAGVLTGVGQLVLGRLASGNGIDITEAIWCRAGRLPWVRTLGSAMLSVVLVGMGVSLGRAGAPKQTGAVLADALSDAYRLSDHERQLLVACGAGAGLSAVYGVPLGGSIFALEVLRGALSLRFVLPALLTSIVATTLFGSMLPGVPIYVIPRYSSSISSSVWAVLVGPIAGVVSVGYVRAIAFADRHTPTGWKRLVAPVLALGLLGVVSIPFPQVLGNGRDTAQLAFTGGLSFSTLLTLVVLKPAATLLCVGSGAPGGLFTPSLALGAFLGGLLGHLWLLIWPGAPPGLFAVLGAGAVLAATTQGPISAVVLTMELTGPDRSFILPLMLVVTIATLVSRTIEARSIYEARLSDDQVADRMRMREGVPE